MKNEMIFTFQDFTNFQLLATWMPNFSTILYLCGYVLKFMMFILMMVRTKYSVSMNIPTFVRFVYEVTKILHKGTEL